MKILCFTDNHFCEKSSIIQKYGTKYSLRIENQLASLNWMEEEAIKNKCEAVICLGDFFDKPELNEQEITALNDIKWNNLPHYFIVGNHESSINTLQYSSVKVLESSNRTIIDKPLQLSVNDCELCFLPYIIESDRKPLQEYFKHKQLAHRIIFSHNDIKGIQMGPIISKSGIDLTEIDKTCDLFLNGHLHNGKKITKNALNLGNLTGKDFGEDSTRYSHNVLILDTETLQYQLIENPFAFNFYKLNIDTAADITKLDNLKNQAVITVKCIDKLVDKVKAEIAKLTQNKKIIESRVIITKELTNPDTAIDISDLTVDHLARFVECCKDKINNSKVLEEELAEVCK